MNQMHIQMLSVRPLLLFLIVSFFSINCLGQGTTDVNKIFENKTELYFRFANEATLPVHLHKIISIDHKTNEDWIYAYANKKEFTNFLKLNVEFEILQHPGTLIMPEMRSNVKIDEIEDWNFYPTYDAYVQIMNQFEQTYPSLCDVFSIGNTEEGRSLLFAKISDNFGANENKPKFLYTSSMHGDETGGYVMMLHLIDHLLSNYGSDAQVTNLVSNVEIWINPLANPDGTYHSSNNTVYGATRYNANGVDLNRNYPDPEDGQHPDGNAWQPETLEFMDLADSVPFVMSANFHSGAEVFNYPWDTWAPLHADDAWWQYVGREWADTVHEYGPPGYFTALNNGITNGYAWYSTAGSRQDYMNYFQHCREVTLEITNTKVLPESLLEDYWDYNYRSFLNYIEQASFGFYGSVTDSISGEPLAASIFINGHDISESWVETNPLTGWYFRPIYEGIYQDITCWAFGYEAKTIDQVQVFNRQQTQLDIQLVPTGSGLSGYEAENSFRVGPNPNSGSFKIFRMTSLRTESLIKIYNLSRRCGSFRKTQILW